MDGAGGGDRLARAIEAIEAAEHLPALRRAIDGLRAPYGLKHAVLYAMARPGDPAAQDTVLFTYPHEWIEHYFRRRYGDIDPVMIAGERAIVPVDWATLDRTPPAVRRFFGEAADVGVGRQGLTLTSRAPSGARALLSVTSEATDGDWRGLRLDLMRDMGVVNAHLHAKLLALAEAARPADAPARLSGRERETLQWAAVGKTIEQTASILGLSASAVRSYLDAARRKLDCLTKPQAVAAAVRLGLIEG